MRTLTALLFALLLLTPVSAQETPTPVGSDDMEATFRAVEAAIDALPVIVATDVFPSVEITEQPNSVTINIDTQPDAAPVDTPAPEPAGVPRDTANIAMIVGGIVFVALIGVAGFLLKKSGDQLYNSLPAIAQYGVQAGGEYLLHRASLTPEADDDTAIEGALRALGFVVVREEDGSITLRRPAPVMQGPTISAQTVAGAQQATVTFTPVNNGVTREEVARMVMEAIDERYALGTPLAPQAPTPAEADAIAAQRQAAVDPMWPDVG